MLAKIISGANVGLDALPIIVEIDIALQGLPSFTIVGLADRAVEESKERVRSAIRNSGAEFPSRKITVNLAPADLPKEGPAYDLPIALGLLLASEQIPPQFKDLNFSNTLIVGELSLDGTIRKTQGVLPLVLMCKRLNITKMILPTANEKEAAIIEGIEAYAFDTLKEIIEVFLGQKSKEPVRKITTNFTHEVEFEYNFSQIKGQEQAKRALEIAAAGGHNILLKGPPGAGKTLLARSFPSILPPLSFDESLEVSAIYSISGGLTSQQPLITTRPFRAPHHSASHVGIVGGGNSIKPGEISLAHRGVLFLDEFPEFPRSVLEALRQPLEDRQVTISRASGTLTFPAQFILFASQNPCPCGFLGDRKKPCICMPSAIARYQKKVSGPIIDRIDIYLEVPAVDVEKLTDLKVGEDSKVVRDRVIKAREVQRARFNNSKILTNSEMGNNEIKEFCGLTADGLSILKQAISSLNLSARSYHRVLKLARTIADLAGSEKILEEHLAESLQYRAREGVI